MMNSNRKFLFVLTLGLAVPLLWSGAPVAAYQGGGYGGGGGQRGGGPRGMMSPDDQLKRLTKELDLTADQRSKIKPILVDTQKKIEDVRDNSSNGDRQAMREKLMQIRQDNNDQIRALLNDSQKEKYDKIQEQREDRMGGSRRGGSGGPGGPGGAGGDNSGSGNGGSSGSTPAPQN